MDDAKLSALTPVRMASAVTRIETGPLTILRLFRPTDAEVAAASQRLGFALGVEPLRLTDQAARNVRVGPGEWVVLGADDAWSGKLGDILHHLTDVGHSRARWRLNECGADLLQRGCSLDLDPAVFAPGACTPTLLAQVSVMILRPGAGPELDVIGDIALADYLEAWLTDAATGLS
ncbi:MAG TPA: hypothetical protein VGL66_01950 [Caulobacteraceae bacterium]|jgi:sarcosine oxidase subunit gamma